MLAHRTRRGKQEGGQKGNETKSDKRAVTCGFLAVPLSAHTLLKIPNFVMSLVHWLLLVCIYSDVSALQTFG